MNVSSVFSTQFLPATGEINHLFSVCLTEYIVEDSLLEHRTSYFDSGSPDDLSAGIESDGGPLVNNDPHVPWFRVAVYRMVTSKRRY